MKISRISSITSNNTYMPAIRNQQANQEVRKNIPVKNIPTESIKANYIPSFGRLKTVGEITIYDRETKSPVSAKIKRDSYGRSDLDYQLHVNGEQVGYMRLICDSLFPEDNFVISEPDDIFPEIRNLRTIKGDKYEGIGSALVSIAVEESRRRGKNGAVWLASERGYAYNLSPYRQYENPIPFYYKLGFKAVNPKEDEYIRKCIENDKTYNLPDSSLLLLTSEAAKAKNKYLSKTFTIQ